MVSAVNSPLMESAQSGEKSILLQVTKFADMTEVLKLAGNRRWWRLRDSDPRPPANGWLIINHSADGPKISDIFDNVPQEQPDIYSWATECALVGSSLYVIGGLGSSIFAEKKSRFLNRIYSLDTLNPAGGWKTCNPLPFTSTSFYVLPAGNFLFLFPHISSFEIKEDYFWSYAWAYVYDTIEQKGHPIKPPPFISFSKNFDFEISGSENCDWPNYDWNNPDWDNCDFEGPTHLRAVLDNRLALVPIVEKEHAYLYDADQDSWEPDYNYTLASNDYFPFNDLVPHYAFSDGIVYAYSFGSRFINVYDTHTRRFYKIRLPDEFEFCGVGIQNVCVEEEQCTMVAIGDSKLCFLWNEFERLRSTLYYTKMKVSLDPFPVATILEHRIFKNLKFAHLHSCLPFDSYADLNKDISVSTSNDTGTGIKGTMPLEKGHIEMNKPYDNFFEEKLKWQKQWLLDKVQATPKVCQQTMNLPSWEHKSVSSLSPPGVASPIITSSSCCQRRGMHAVSSFKESHIIGSQSGRYLAYGRRFLSKCIKK